MWNLLVCSLAYSGKLHELTESILADRSLATSADQDGRKALHWVCSAGHTHIVGFLLQLGVPVSEKDGAGWSPLHIAASAGHEEIVKALLGKGAQVNAVNQNGCTPLHYAASKHRHEIAALLLEGAKALLRAAAKGNLKMVQTLLRYSASTNIQDTEGNTPLHLACSERLEESKLLVSQGASIDLENKEGKTPLQDANGLNLPVKRLV
uniref:26S proteasome non-ATPase regulatory subunit 10 n=1 Tax=Castor canadensis TaxID=51338 RepID=A0A8C0WK26_CASCN